LGDLATTRCADGLDAANGSSPKGGSARERAIRCHRGVIGSCVAALPAILFLPI
jgi:hypothetical protein